MTTFMQALYGVAMILIGGLKTWLHMGSIPMLTLPTCNGDTLTLALSNASWFERAHCWGCYMLAVGLIVTTFALYQEAMKRRSVAPLTD